MSSLSNQLAKYVLSILAGVALCFVFVESSPAAEKYALTESADDGRVFEVQSHVVVKGHLQTATALGQAVKLDLKADAKLVFLERRLSGTGRDAESLKSARYYSAAEARIQVNKRTTVPRLRSRHRLVVAQGRREGLLLYCPNNSLSFEELELLQTPGDSLAAIALLPRTSVGIGESWKIDTWAIQLLTGVEAVLENELTCRLDSVQSQIAKVSFKGQVKGAVVGAATQLSVAGYYLFDLKNNHLTHIEINQTEKRSIGTVSPGLDVRATVVVKRSLTKSVGVLTDQRVAKISLQPSDAQLRLQFQTHWRVTFFYGRDWHLFHQTRDVAVLRLLDKGRLIAQCNVSPVPSVKPGEHTSEKRFQTDIRASLGNNLLSIEKAEQIKSGDNRYLYRVTAIGKSNGRPMHWFYYLCSGPSGTQVALVFAVESEKVETLANRDLLIVKGIQFSQPRRVSGLK